LPTSTSVAMDGILHPCFGLCLLVDARALSGFFSFLFFLFTYIWYYPLMDPAGGFPASTDQPRPFCFFLACMLCSRVRTSRGRGTRHGFVLFSRIVCSTASLALCTLRTQLPSVTKVADGYMPCGACYEIIIASQQGKQLMA
jgi:hypothetical protein